MKFALCLSLSLALLSFGRAAAADEAARVNPLSIGVEGAVVVPTGDWSDIAGIGLGALARVDYTVSPKLAIAALPGFVAHLVEEQGGSVETSTSELLLLGGARFFPVPAVDLHAFTGLNVWTFRGSVGGDSDSESESRVAFLMGGSYSLPSGLTFGGDLFIPNLIGGREEEDLQVGVLFKVGYTRSL